MDLIIGGAYQGKCTFAAEKYRLTAADICDLAADAPAPARCYVHLEALTRRGQAAEALPLLLAAEVVVAREIGSGVVPIDAGERAWRGRPITRRRRFPPRRPQKAAPGKAEPVSSRMRVCA